MCALAPSAHYELRLRVPNVHVAFKSRMCAWAASAECAFSHYVPNVCVQLLVLKMIGLPLCDVGRLMELTLIKFLLGDIISLCHQHKC